MDIKELKQKHPLYNKNIENWDFWWLSYEGGKEFIKKCLNRHQRETNKNYQDRLNEGYNFNYCKSIVDLFNFYLTEKPCKRELGGLHDDQQWQMFLADCDLNNTNFDVFINDSQKIASVYGAIGILVNKSGQAGLTIAEEKKHRIYPYCTVYTLPKIWDWKFEKNQMTGRPELTFLKLECDDGQLLIWTKEKWELWQLPDGRRVAQPEKTDSGENLLGEIPFLWMPNVRNITQPILGLSDVSEISLIVASIARNLSCGEEIIKYAGFPMFRTPYERDDGNGDAEGGGEKTVGNRAVVGFNPEDGADGKPDWLESPVLEPIEGAIQWIDKKVDELFRIAHLSGVHGQRKSNNQFASGLALRYEFQQLNSVLLQKSNFMAETEYKIIELWLKWQKKEANLNDVKVEKSKAFSIDDLSMNLENAIKAINTVNSRTFSKEIQKSLTRQIAPDLSEATFAKIDKEIEAEKKPKEEPELDENGKPIKKDEDE